MKLNEEAPSSEASSVDMQLVEQIINLIPKHTWFAVLDATVANIVDELPTEIMFAMCELYLTDYYLNNPEEIIPDLMRIKGEENALYILDSLQLNKIPEPKPNQEDNGVSETDPA